MPSGRTTLVPADLTTSETDGAMASVATVTARGVAVRVAGTSTVQEGRSTICVLEIAEVDQMPPIVVQTAARRSTSSASASSLAGIVSASVMPVPAHVPTEEARPHAACGRSELWDHLTSTSSPRAT